MGDQPRGAGRFSALIFSAVMARDGPLLGLAVPPT